jgi:hypothetical protein
LKNTIIPTMTIKTTTRPVKTNEAGEGNLFILLN